MMTINIKFSQIFSQMKSWNLDRLRMFFGVLQKEGNVNSDKDSIKTFPFSASKAKGQKRFPFPVLLSPPPYP